MTAVIFESTTHKAMTAGTVAPARPVITRLAFMSRFSDAELAGIYTAAKTDIRVEIFLDKVRAADSVTLTDPRTVAGVQALAAAGLIEASRVPEILGGGA